jgi:hypothetical protein
MRFSTVLAVATCSLLSACAAPAHVQPTTMVDARVRQVATVDIAPVNVQLVIEPGAEGETGAVRSRAEASLANTAIDALAKHQYTIGALRHRGDAPSTADATLYIAGSSYVPAPRMPRANIIAEHVAQGVVHGAAVAANVTACADDTDCVYVVAQDDLYRQAVNEQCGSDETCLRAMLAITTEDDVRLPGPGNDNEAVGAAPSPSLYVAMTLVDNRTGAILWHSHATTRTNAAHTKDVEKTARTLIASLPTR